MRTNKPLDMGNGFLDHGPAISVSSSKGVVATVDGAGRDVVLVWLADHRGGYALLMIDAETGRSEQIPMPFAPEGGCSFASILSSRNRFYTHFNGQFVEFDPARKEFTFVHASFPQVAMSMTEDDAGRIWTVTFPDSGVMCFDPTTREFRDYGHVYNQNWKQYQRSLAADSEGWIYFAVGNTASQIIVLDPVSGQSRPILDEGERKQGSAYVYRDENGRVYGMPFDGDEKVWLEFYRGECVKLAGEPPRKTKRIIAGSQGLFHREFPGGRRIVSVDLTGRNLVTEKPDAKSACEVHFDYTGDGAHLMGVAVAPGKTICGAAAFPMVSFRYDPENASWVENACRRQWNTMAMDGDRIFIGGYTQGALLEWDTSKPWADPEGEGAESNPARLVICEPAINRPHSLLVCPDGKTVIMAGSPAYGCSGGGMLFWNREARTWTLLEHTAILPEHTTMSMLPLPGGRFLGGTSTRPGSGGERKATEAELYVMNVETRQVEWHQAMFPGAQEYTDMCVGPDGLIYGLVGMEPWDPLVLEYGKRFFVFDPISRNVIHEQDAEAEFGQVGYQQGPRKFVKGPDGQIYVLFLKCIAVVEPVTFKLKCLMESPVPVRTGGDMLDGRIYFASGSHVYSVKAP